MAAAVREQPLGIVNMAVLYGRIECEVAVRRPFTGYSSPELAQAVLAAFPTLARHACKNAQGRAFGDVIGHTSIPHLLEHLVIDIQTRQCPDPDRTFVGTTEWLDEGAGVALVQVSFTDDLNALRAFRDASQILNNAMVEYENSLIAKR